MTLQRKPKVKYILYCEPCGFKKVIEGTEDKELTPVPTVKIQTQIPVWNDEKKEIQEGKPRNQPKKYKCPKCGRTITIKHYNVPEEKKKDDKI